MQREVGAASRLVGTLRVPGDKSMTHRALLLGALAHGTTQVVAPLAAEDTWTTARVLGELGVHIEGVRTSLEAAGRGDAQASETVWTVQGLGADGFRRGAHAAPTLDCGNSGTTLRLLVGALAGHGGRARLVGDASLMRRPMARLVGPLRALGARVRCGADGRAPVEVGDLDAGPRAPSARLRGAEVTLEVASAQVKSAVLLAALGAEGTTSVRGRIDSRDHTERMLGPFGAVLERLPGALTLAGPQPLRGCRVQVPGDPSTASFFWAAAALLPGSDVRTPDVSLNPSRLGFLRLLQRMGADVEVTPGEDDGGEPRGLVRVRHAHEDDGGEPRGLVRVRHAPLVGCAVAPEMVPTLIDELPLLAVLAQHARGTTQVRGAAELRHKESDRIAAMAHNLRALGGHLDELEDGFCVRGPRSLRKGQLQSFGDHRVAMASTVAALAAEGCSTLADAGCVAVSYPDFFAAIGRLGVPNAGAPARAPSLRGVT